MVRRDLRCVPKGHRTMPKGKGAHGGAPSGSVYVDPVPKVVLGEPLENLSHRELKGLIVRGG